MSGGLFELSDSRSAEKEGVAAGETSSDGVELVVFD